MLWIIDWGYPPTRHKPGLIPERSYHMVFETEQEAIAWADLHLKDKGPIQANYRIYQGPLKKTVD